MLSSYTDKGEMLINSKEAVTGSGTIESQASQIAADETLGFTILQCKTCRSIIGDTSSLVIYNKETSLLTLQKKSNNIIIDEELVTSKGEFDYGSTFNNLHCKNCNEWLGRTYRTTTPELDHVRGRFSYNLTSLVIYEIAEVELPTQTQSDENGGKSSGVDQIEITKLQKFVMALYDRLEQLEAENDLLKSEMLSLANKLENHSGNVFVGSTQKPAKIRKIREKKEEFGTQETQLPTQITFEPIKTIAASLSTSDFELKPLSEQHRILSSIDEDSALETISWSILNSGRIPKLQQEIDF